MRTPAKIGRYQINRVCGQGGMAIVYHATDPIDGSAVAVKVINNHLLLDSDLESRFHHEAEVLQALRHPAIVPLLDFGEADGKLYMVMPFITGGTLRDRLQDGPLSLAETAHIIDQIASALATAHAEKIIHRDIKPHNILLDEDGKAYLCDFGVARILDFDSAEKTVTMIGTPEYMAPEQILEGGLSHKTDIYQLGIVLYQMVTGWLPYEGSAHQIMTQHLQAPIPSATKIVPDLPPLIDVILQKALAKLEQERFETIETFNSAFQSLVEPSDLFIGSEPHEQVLAAVPVPTAPTNRLKSLALVGMMAFLGLFGFGLQAEGFLPTFNQPQTAIITVSQAIESEAGSLVNEVENVIVPALNRIDSADNASILTDNELIEDALTDSDADPSAEAPSTNELPTQFPDDDGDDDDDDDDNNNGRNRNRDGGRDRRGGNGGDGGNGGNGGNNGN